ncbi:ATP-binding cassette sub-family A member 10 [Rhynchocyon petersi]
MVKKKISLCQQTQALLCKNLLKKWRLKGESLMEWSVALFLGLYLCVFPQTFSAVQFPERPPHVLGRVDEFNDSDLMVAYTPVTNVTQKIMEKMALASFMKGRKIIATHDEETMDAIPLQKGYHQTMGIVFNDTFSYQLKFTWGYRVPILKEHPEYGEHCWDFSEEVFCYLTTYWKAGLVAFQTAINAAIIEVTTNHSVMEELTSVIGINMRILPFITKGTIVNEWFIFFCIISFSPFTYFASLNITRERKKLKKFMTVLGLQESAFWLSWGLVYAILVFSLSMPLTLLITSLQMVVITGFMAIFTLFFLYGLSLITLVFLLSVLIKKPILTGLVVFFSTIFWGCLGFTVMHRQLPSFLEWILGLFSPFALTAGLSQITHLDYYMSGIVFPDPSGESYKMIGTFFILAFDTLLYLILTLYFERVLPDEDGHRLSPLFFLKSSFWFQPQNTHHGVFENEINPEHSSDDSFEPVSPEFHGKEAIRIRNIKKEYNGKPDKVPALQGICFDVYEGQVTAVLGHSGAGKSTLLNILSGLSVSTEGSATIYNTILSPSSNMEELRKNIGFCPQFNIQFDFLTVSENLRLFAKIRGIQPKEVEQEVKRIIMELDMQNIQHVLAAELSGGQRRKLTFGIALLGDPQVLLLDEPTAGLDPFSRHQAWSLLKEKKSGHVILFSTQFMDEADILADRKVFLSNGKLRCAGSSLFLKRKWGIGYHLSLHRNELCDPQRVTALIKKHIPEAKLRAESVEKLVYTLPLEKTNKFPDLYNDLDKCSDQGIMNYGVSMTTLDEVFSNLEGKPTIDEPDFGIWKQEKIDMTRDTENKSEIQQALHSLPEIKALSAGTIWRRQVWAVAKLRFLKLRHDRKAILSFVIYKMYRQTHRWEFSPTMYFLSLEQRPRDPLTRLLIINDTGSNIEDFLHSLAHQNISLEVDNFKNRNGSDDPSYNGAIIVSGDEKGYRFSVACNTKRMNCFPVLMGIVSNGLLGLFNSTRYIRMERSVFPYDDIILEMGFLEGSAFFLLTVACCMSPYIGMSSIGDYKKKAQSLLRISGLCPSAYWCGQAVVDIPFYCLILLSAFFTQHFLSPETVLSAELTFAMVVCIFGSAASLIFLTYVISFLFRKGKKNNGPWSFAFFIVSYDSTNTSETLNSGINEGFEPLLLTILIPFLQSLLFLFIIRCLEMKYGSQTIRKDPFFRLFARSRSVRPNPESLEEEDEDVKAERLHTANALSAPNMDEKPVIIASCLYKEYSEKKKKCFSTRKRKTAIRNISFCVKKGEVLGLLGHNGAGKSTSIKVLTGDTKPTAGMVVFPGGTALGWPQEDSDLESLGYCPQENSLWPNLTIQDHLELYAAVKGLAKEDATLSISRLVSVFKLRDQLKAPVKTLSEGIKRKLCFVLSILGGPAVVLLDEPSTGMDPDGQQQMWHAIDAFVKNQERGVLLTTHYMAEAEAVCDRVAIMVSGKLRCIGCIQHLKSKFGKDYLLEIKMKEPTHVESLHAEILRLFPQAARQDRFFSLMAYKLPLSDVHPLSQAFFKLEAVKQTFDLEEYSLSQATLEQVFLELSKEQEFRNFDDEIDATVRWNLLPQEE